MIEEKFDLNDITLVPAVLSKIRSRKEVEILYKDSWFGNHLPLIVSPMDTVINNDNVYEFGKHQLLTCSIRQVNIDLNDRRYSFISISLEQFIQLVEDIKNNKLLNILCNGILIDIANGHMDALYNAVTIFKKQFPGFPLMIGNIANPETYKKYCEILTQSDYVRMSVGSGSACTTASNTGIYYPMASLISESYAISCTYESAPKIVADGGFKNFDDIIKCLAIGCFLPYMQVNTSKGLKSIKNININDYVYTHTGKIQKVINKYEYENTKEIVNINGIYSTDNHHYYVIHKKYKNNINDNNIHNYAEWIPAIELNDNYLLIQNNIKIQHQIIRFLRIHIFNIYILYKKIIGELNEKYTNT